MNEYVLNPEVCLLKNELKLGIFLYIVISQE